jgi:rubredoxin
MDRTRIIERAFGLAQAVAEFVARAREFFYEVVLSDRTCPRCGGSLTMEAEGRCRCRACGLAFDPAVAFQACPACGGKPELRVRRYECAGCGAEVVSRFLFESLAFDADYFRQRMAESRERRQEQRERVRTMLAQSRSGVLSPPAADLGAIPGLTDALNGLTAGIEVPFAHLPRDGFDLKRYQCHIQAHIGAIASSFEEIPPLDGNARIDRIWRFIAIIFLAHAGIADVRQHGQTIMVKQRETDREGQGVPGDLEDADGIEGSLGGAEA